MARLDSRRRTERSRPRPSKPQMREELNQLMETFFANGGRITDCNDCKPVRKGHAPAATLDDGVGDLLE